MVTFIRGIVCIALIIAISSRISAQTTASAPETTSPKTTNTIIAFHFGMGTMPPDWIRSYGISVRYDFFGIGYGNVADNPTPEYKTVEDSAGSFSQKRMIGGKTGIDLFIHADLIDRFSAYGTIGFYRYDVRSYKRDSISQELSTESTLGIGGGAQYNTGISVLPNMYLSFGAYLHSLRGIGVQIGLWGYKPR